MQPLHLVPQPEGAGHEWGCRGEQQAPSSLGGTGPKAHRLGPGQQEVLARPREGSLREVHQKKPLVCDFPQRLQAAQRLWAYTWGKQGAGVPVPRRVGRARPALFSFTSSVTGTPARGTQPLGLCRGRLCPGPRGGADEGPSFMATQPSRGTQRGLESQHSLLPPKLQPQSPQPPRPQPCSKTQGTQVAKATLRPESEPCGWARMAGDNHGGWPMLPKPPPAPSSSTPHARLLSRGWNTSQPCPMSPGFTSLEGEPREVGPLLLESLRVGSQGTGGAGGPGQVVRGQSGGRPQGSGSLGRPTWSRQCCTWCHTTSR